MGIEPTWDSPHCPTPDLKSGSPTSELGTSGRFITEMARPVEILVAPAKNDDLVMFSKSRFSGGDQPRPYDAC